MASCECAPTMTSMSGTARASSRSTFEPWCDSTTTTSARPRRRGTHAPRGLDAAAEAQATHVLSRLPVWSVLW